MSVQMSAHDGIKLRVSGTITAADGGVLPAGLNVSAYDIDLPTESLLGTSGLNDSGGFTIDYSSASYAADDAGTADIVVRVYDAAGTVVAESDLRVNAPPDFEVNLTIEPARPPTEWEQYLALLDSVRQDVPLAELTDKHVEFLARELKIPLDRIGMMRAAARNAPGLLASPELIYGLARMEMGATAAELSVHDADKVTAAVARAVEQRIVPPVDPALLARMLARLGRARADQEPLARVLDGVNDPGADAVIKAFTGRGLRSFGDVKSAAGLEAFAQAERESPGPALEVIRSHVNLSVLAPDLPMRTALLNHGYRGVADVAADALEEFLATTEKTIDPFVATTLHTQAVLVHEFIKKTVLEARVGGTRQGDAAKAGTGVLVQAARAAKTACACTDCESAVSPLAYLADLLKYCHDSLRDGTQRVDYLRLGRELHQKFGDLPTECGAIEEEVHQVRIAIEVLRAHLAAHPPSTGDATILQNAEREYLRAAYEQLLVRLGTSYADLRLAVVAPAGDQAELAGQIGIRAPAGGTNHLRGLLLDVSGTAVATLEGALERLFGLEDTRRDPLAAGPIPNLLTWRRERLRDIWLGQDWPDDTPGPGIALVDPDLIGPDDFRSADPAQPTGAFAIWRRRRAWVDLQLSNLLARAPAANDASRLDTMLDAMFVQAGAAALPPYPLAGGGTAPARWWPSTKAALLALDGVLSTGTKPAVAATISNLSTSYGLGVEAFQRLLVLRDKDLASLPAGSINAPPTEAETREFASILTQGRKRLHAADWTAEEQIAEARSNANLSLEFGPGDFWMSLTEPDAGEWPPADDARSPWIDPELVRLSDLPDSSAGAAARQLWGTRRQVLQDFKTTQIGPARRTQFDGVFPVAFGALPTGLPGITTWAAYVENTLQTLGSSVILDVAAARTRLGQLFLGEDPFRRLMVIRAKHANADQTLKPTAAEYEEADLILLGAYKRRTLYPAWRTYERTGATALSDWQALKVRLPPWRGAPEDRAAWQAALRQRGERPLVDPDLTAATFLKVAPAAVPATPTKPAEFAAQLWEARRTALIAKVAAIKTARVSAAAAADQGFSAALAAAATPALLTRGDLSDLRARLAAGAGMAKRLAQLGLDADAFQYLGRIDELVSAAGAQAVDGPEWEEVYSILAEVWKRRRGLAWRQAERVAGITLGPDCFATPTVDWNQFPPPLPPDPPRWRATAGRRQAWEDRLEARTNQDREIETALARLVSAVEDATLPLLRDALVAAVPLASLPGGASALTLSLKAKRLSEQLLIDLKMSGCAKTTRVAQAIETIQNVMFSLRGGLLQAYPAWKLTAAAQANFDAVWTWLGSYASWRAAMFVVLYPENLLVPSLRRERTPAFSGVLSDLRSRGTLSGADAAATTAGFVGYLRDVAELVITPSSQVESRFVDEGQPPPVSLSPSGTIPVRFLFGLAPSSHRIYWSIVFRGRQGDVQSPWRVLTPFTNDVTSVLGTVLYRTPGGRRFLYLFARSSRDGEDLIGFARFDLDAEGRWSPAEAEPLDADGETRFTNVALLNTPENVPPAIRVTTPARVIDIQLGVKGVASSITTTTAGNPMSWSTVRRAPELLVLLGGQFSVPGGFALRRGSLGTRYDLVVFELSVSRTNFTYWGELKVIRGIGADGAPPAAGQGTFRAVGDKTAADDSLPVPAWAFGHDSAGNRPVSCAIAVADVDGDQKEDLIIIHIAEGSGVTPARMYCRLGLGLNDDGTADSWVDSTTPMFAALPANPGPCAVAVLRRGSTTFDLLVAGAGEAAGQTIWLKKITVRLQNGVLSFSDARNGPTFPAARTVGGVGLAIADLDGDGVDDLLIHWTEQSATAQTASRLRYGARIDADGFPASWSVPIDVDGALYQGWDSLSRPAGSGLAVGGLTGAPGRFDAVIASFSKSGSSNVTTSREWRYFVANSVNLRLAPANQAVFNTSQYKPYLVAPLVPSSYDYRLGADRSHSPSLPLVSNSNAGKTRINQALLAEAFFFVPLAVALQLQRSGDYLAALDWFRSIYDYSKPRASRAIYPGLEPNAGGSAVWREPNWQWLQDPLDPHGIAEGRTGTYKLFIIQAVVRCLLEYADAEFTRDTSESITLARALYLEALELLEDGDLKQTYNGCDQLREWIVFVIGDLETPPSPTARQDVYDLLNSGNLRELADVSTTLGLAHLAGALSSENEAKIRSVAAGAAKAPAPPRTLAETFTAQVKVDAKLAQAFASDAQYAPEMTALTTGVSEAIGDLFTGTFGSSYETGMFGRAFALKELPEGTRGLIVPGGGYADPARKDIGGLFGSYVGVLGTRLFTERPPKHPGPVVIGGGRELPPTPPAQVPSLLAIDACVPPNPVLKSLRLRADLNLYKIRTCRSITGERRQVDPYSAATDTSTGMPSIGAGGQLVVPGLASLAPTPYRFSVLVERAKSLVQLAQQTENAMFAAIQGGDTERYTALRARQDLGSARAGVTLQTLRINEAQGNIALTQIQREKTQIEVDQYSEWIQAGLSSFEETALGAMWVAFGFNTGGAVLAAGAASTFTASAFFASNAPGLLVSAAGSAAAASSQIAQIYQFWAAHEEKRKNWTFQRNLAQQDRRIADQQFLISHDQLRVVTQEQTIASLNETHASATVEFLAQKFTNTDLYDWMADVLQGVYRYFLQQSAGTARLAAAQLAFERQEAPPPFIQPDYWTPPSDDGSVSAGGKAPDRRGLTGSARLLQDITQLDQFAFTTDRRKLQLSRTISVAQTAPLEFQKFRDTGVLSFETPMELFDRDFPGHYLRLVHRVRVALLALTPALGVRATLTANRVSRVVIGGDLFQTVRVSHGPDMVALSSPRDTAGLFELDAQPDMLRPFENIGVSTTWELRMPRAANPFDFSTIADVFFTIEYTALHSADYQQQVVPRLGRRVTARRAWSFRSQFADQWYELNNPDLSTTPMHVRFETAAQDFPPNVEAASLSADDIALHFVHGNGHRSEISGVGLRLKERGAAAFVGGSANTIDGTISTATGSAGSWMPMQTKAPIGQWELSLPNTEETRSRFQGGDIIDVMLVVTYSGQLPAWPE